MELVTRMSTPTPYKLNFVIKYGSGWDQVVDNGSSYKTKVTHLKVIFPPEKELPRNISRFVFYILIEFIKSMIAWANLDDIVY